MKKCFSILFFTLLILSMNTFAIQISYNMSNYQGGNNISCNGANDGWINIVVVDGTQPYYFNWSNGSYNQNLSNLTAGNYTVIVTDASGATSSTTISLRQPNSLIVNLNPTTYDGGYNISYQGGQDGMIETDISGGTQDYTFLWNTGSTENNISNLSAGNYNVIITDMNGCSTNGSTTLNEPTALHVVNISSPFHNGYNVSCYEGRDGAINLNVSGGAPPYSYNWSTGSELQNISELYAGHYSVTIHDASGGVIAAQIDLTQPSQLRISSITPFIHSNGYNMSCYSCANGSLTVNTTGGVSPLIYHWETGQTTNPLTGIGQGVYYVIVTDANSCSTTSSKNVIAPPIDAWTLSGNSNINPAIQYLGTSDNKSVVLKTNNTERVKFHDNGNIVFKSPVTIDDLTVIKPLKTDTLRVCRIMAADSDSIISFGISSMHFNQNTNNLWCDPAFCITTGWPSPHTTCFFKGMSIGTGSLGWGLNSIAIGNNVWTGGTNSLAIGSGANGSSLLNSVNNTLAIGFNSNISTLFVTESSGVGTTGKVGIGGISTPTEKLQIDHGDVLIHGINNFTGPSDDAILKLGDPANYIKGKNGSGVRIGTIGFPDIINISSNKGIVGIGTDPDLEITTNATNYKLLVGGTLGAHEIFVSLGAGPNGWPDYVFAKDYKKKNLIEIKKFIEKNNHLPDMPSAQEVNATGSFNVGEIQTKTVKEIEEIYLHLFTLQDEIEKLKQENIKLHKLIDNTVK